MQIRGSVALVTGANRGLGRAFAVALVERGARTVYAAARQTSSITEPGLTPIRLDITDPDQVAAAAERCADLTLLVNNAGVLTGSPLIGAATLEGARQEIEVNYFSTLVMCRAFAPVLGRQGGGAIVNMLSIASFFAPPQNGSYAASKAAAWAMTNGIRTELRSQGTQVVAVHAGFIDTDMAAHIPPEQKISAASVAALTFDAVEAGAEEVLADDRTRNMKASVPRDLELIYPTLQKTWDSRR